MSKVYILVSLFEPHLNNNSPKCFVILNPPLLVLTKLLLETHYGLWVDQNYSHPNVSNKCYVKYKNVKWLLLLNDIIKQWWFFFCG